MKPADLQGLVLAGGRSLRMGSDKARLQVHGQNQLVWTAKLLAPFCQSVHASVRLDQVETLGKSGLHLIPDQLENSGPLAGILAALQQVPDNGWLVVACDMPWLSPATLKQMIKHRDRSKPATAFAGSKGPEPLCAIWESAALEPLAIALNKGQRSPRRILAQPAHRASYTQRSENPAQHQYARVAGTGSAGFCLEAVGLRGP